MEFQVNTTYDKRAIYVLNRGGSEVGNTRMSSLWRLAGIVITAYLIILTVYIADIESLRFQMVINMVAAAIIGGWTLFVYRIRTALIDKMMPPEDRKQKATFTEEGYLMESTLRDQCSYEDVLGIAQTADYFLICVSKRRGYALDKKGFTQGDAAQFAAFLERKTGRQMKDLKF